MNHIKKILSSFSALILLLAPLSFVTILTPQLASAGVNQCTWTGGGVDDNWSTDANWVCSVGTGPATGYDLIFPFSPSAQFPTNDLPETNEYSGIWFTGDSGTSGCSGLAYSIDVGSGFLLAGDINTENVTGTCQPYSSFGGFGSITLTSDSTWQASDTMGLIMQMYDSVSGSAVNLNGNNLIFTAEDFVDGFGGRASTVARLTDGITGNGNVTITGVNTTLTEIAFNNTNITPRPTNSFTGAFTLSDNTRILIDDTNTLGTGTVTAGAESTIRFFGDASTFCTFTGTINIATDFIFSGNSVEPNIKYDNSCIQAPGIGLSYEKALDPNVDIVLSGDVTLNGDLIIQTGASTTSLTGNINGVAQSINIFENPGGSLVTRAGAGQLIVNGITNNSLTTNGAYNSPINSETLTDTLPSTDIVVGAGNIITVTGERRDVSVYNSGVLMGTGTIANLTSEGGVLRPGLSPGVMNTGNLDFDSATVMDAELEGTGAGQYDQFNVTGTVSLGNATLNTILFNGYAPNISDSFTIINNDGADAITGIFAGLTEGAEITVSNYKFTISYVGGTGNDVVLTTTYVPGPPGTGLGIYQNSMFVPVLGIISGLSIFAYAQRKRLSIFNKR